MLDTVYNGIKLFLCGDFVVIYADVLVVLNTLVNYFMLLAVNKIGRNGTTRMRMCLGALTGGLSSLLIFLDKLGVVMTVLKIISGILMTGVTFGVKPIKRFLKNTFWIFSVCFVFGGVTFALYMFFEIDLMLYTNGIIYFDADMTFLTVTAVVSYFIITAISKLTDKAAPSKYEYFVTVQKGNSVVSCKGLMDTGNSLREPFSDYPVVMADRCVFEQLVGKITTLDDIEENGEIRLIPISTVNDVTLVKAVRPDFLKIGDFETDKVYIAESDMPLDEYKIILNINLEGEMHNEKYHSVF